MNYSRLWTTALKTAFDEWVSLDHIIAQKVRALSFEIMSIKQEIHGTTELCNAPEICSRCNGACCSSGKYHFSAIDLLPYFTCEKPVFSPDFSNGSCPYLSESRCLMQPEFRPYTCVTFICESIEDNLSIAQKIELKSKSEKLKAVYREIESIFGRRLSGGLLHYAELLGDSRNGIFTDKHI